MPSRPQHPVRSRHRLLIAAWAVALVVSTATLGALRLHAATPATVSITPAPGCGLADNSACYYLGLAKGYIAGQDFSDLLELQSPVLITCPDPAFAGTYCQGVTRKIQLQLFSVTQSGQAVLVTRNQYAALFKQFFSASGPFHFAAESQSGTSASLIYKNAAATATYELLFTKNAGAWQVERPLITGLGL